MHHSRAAERGVSVTAALVVVALLVVGAIAVLHLVASWRADRAQAGWEATLGTRDAVFGRNPTTGANAAALELERLAAPLGIELAPRNAEGRPEADPDVKARREAIKPALGEYGTRELERADSPVEPPPPEVAAFLRDHADTLAAVRRHLNEAGVPAWETEFSRLAAAPIPNLLGNIDLAKLLTADAFARIAAGDPATASENLGAVWQLSRSLRETPILINQLISVAEARYVAGALRHLQPVHREWGERLVEHDYLDSMLDALRHDGWVLGQYAAVEESDESLGVTWLPGLIADPLARMKLAGAADRYRERLAEVATIDALCDGSTVQLDEPPQRSLSESMASFSLWMPDDHSFIPNISSTIRRVARLEMEVELTRKLLALQAERGDGAWPAQADWIGRSDVCPDDRWIYETRADGSMRLEFSRGELPWPQMKGARLPNRVVR